MIVNSVHISLSEVEDKSILGLLSFFKLSGKRVAIEYNGTILTNDQYSKILLDESDIIEIIHFVGGG